MPDLISKYQKLIGDNPLFQLLASKKCRVEAPASKDIQPLVFRSTPGYINGTMRDYQLSGLNWLIHMHSQSINCILADEMGLGKTLQTISFLGYLKECASVKRPHLLIVPKSTLQNWQNEFKRFYPSFRIYVFHCPRTDLSEHKKKLKRQKFDVVITTYEMCINSRVLNAIEYSYIVIDEAHRIKNENSKLSQFVRNYSVENRLLITGTPLQNNLRELWALLNFLIPELFNDAEIFEEWLMVEETSKKEVGLIKKVGRPKRTHLIEESDENNKKGLKASNKDRKRNNEKNNKVENKRTHVIEESEEEIDIEELKDEENKNEEEIMQSSIKEEIMHRKRDKEDVNAGKEKESVDQMKINALRQVIMPFFLRREKNEVETQLLPKRVVNLYPLLTEMQRLWYRTILRKDIVGDAIQHKAALMNAVCQLRKVCNHPYLFEGAEPEPFTTDEHLVQNSGKMILLDGLLKLFKEQGSKVLIFSQMSRMLDILEDYCLLRDLEYRRLDGSTAIEERNRGIDEFNNDESVFIFLLTTRAGGLGINLTAADIVVIYDSDWNPQMDLQAMDRAHRIGQKKEVKVFRFVSANTIEEKIVERCMYKLKLDECLMRVKKQDKMDKRELLGIIATGIDALDEKSNTTALDINDILKEGEKRTNELNDRINGANLRDSTALDLYKFEGEDYKKISKKLEDFVGTTENLSRRARARKVTRFYDYQFCPDELRKILVIECERDLTPTEIIRQETLMKEVFHWDKHEFYTYLKCCETVGKDIDEIIRKLFPQPKQGVIQNEHKQIASSDMISSNNGDKHSGKLSPSNLNETNQKEEELNSVWCESEVRRYHKIFWKRYEEIADIEKSLATIEKTELKRLRNIEVITILAEKFRDVKLDDVINDEDALVSIFKDLKIVYSQNTRSKSFTEIVDKTLLLLYFFMKEIEIVWLSIKQVSWLKTDYFIRSRDTFDISKRLKTLTDLVIKSEAMRREKIESSKTD